MSYREAKSLQTLLKEIDKAAPRRSTRSDGWIGDAAHATRESDHNPWLNNTVRARDFTHDPPRLDCDVLAKGLAAKLNKHPALGPGAYVIWEDRIISTDQLSDGWRPYDGISPHREHLHLSVGLRGYDSKAPWGVMEVDDMFEKEDRQRLAEATRTIVQTEKKVDQTEKKVDVVIARLKEVEGNVERVRLGNKRRQGDLLEFLRRRFQATDQDIAEVTTILEDGHDGT